MTMQGLDFPNSAGWWAGKQKHREFVVRWTEFEVSGDSVHIRWDDDDYTITYTLSWFKAYYRDTKWFRLYKPWEQPATGAQGVPSPDWSQAPEWAQWWAVDWDGQAYWFGHKPYVLGEMGWVDREFQQAPAGRAWGDWRETLAQRPAQEGE